MTDAVMVQIYLRLVQAGRRTLESVPAHLRQVVEAELNKPGK